MEALLSGLEGTGLAQALRYSRWGYAAVNAGHILGFALLLGSTVALNLRLLGLWRSVPLAPLARVLVPVAAAGLALAVTAGLILFAVRAGEYAGLGVLQAKLAFVAVATVSAIVLHARYGLELHGAGPARQRVHAVVSLSCWLGALTCGRLIAFTAD